MQTLLSPGRRRAPCHGWVDAALVEVEAKGGGLKVGKWPRPFLAGTLGSSSACCAAISHRDSPIAPHQDLTHRPPAGASPQGRKSRAGACTWCTGWADGPDLRQAPGM